MAKAKKSAEETPSVASRATSAIRAQSQRVGRMRAARLRMKPEGLVLMELNEMTKPEMTKNIWTPTAPT